MPLSHKIAFRLIKWRRLHNTESQGRVSTFWLPNAGSVDFLHCSFTYCLDGSFFKLNILVKLLFERPPLKSLRESGVGRLLHNAVISIRVGQKLDSCLKTSTMSEDNFTPNLSTCQFKIGPGVRVPSQEWTREWEGERELIGVKFIIKTSRYTPLAPSPLKEVWQSNPSPSSISATPTTTQLP